MPKKRSMTDKFLKYIEDNGMKYEAKLIEDEDLFSSPLENEKDKKLFDDLKTSYVMIYEIMKINIEKSDEKTISTEQIVEKINNYKDTIEDTDMNKINVESNKIDQSVENNINKIVN